MGMMTPKQRGLQGPGPQALLYYIEGRVGYPRMVFTDAHRLTGEPLSQLQILSQKADVSHASGMWGFVGTSPLLGIGAKASIILQNMVGVDASAPTFAQLSRNERGGYKSCLCLRDHEP